MKLKIKKHNGFTIIETMIVLAIAGLIMLIVFLAVPALQRSARNTSRKNDAGNISSAINTWISNNDGSLPGQTGSGNSCQADLTSAVKGIHLGYYSLTSVYCDTNNNTPSVCSTVGTSGGCASSANELNTEDVIFIEGDSCSGNTPQPSSARSFVVLYEVEASSNTAAEQCIGS
ncbi:type II secretion system GspH family protein [Patescibacteria group bacterium]|nr:type II secretion system GspH family protein [Patescibacteria group bacterium]